MKELFISIDILTDQLILSKDISFYHFL